MPLEGIRIVVLDPHRDSMDALCALLVHQRARAQCTGSMAEAVEACAQLTPDVFIADPVTGDASAMLREIRRERYVPAICFTGWASPEGRQSALRAGFDAFVPKPLDPQELTARIRRVLSR